MKQKHTWPICLSVPNELTKNCNRGRGTTYNNFLFHNLNGTWRIHTKTFLYDSLQAVATLKQWRLTILSKTLHDRQRNSRFHVSTKLLTRCRQLELLILSWTVKSALENQRAASILFTWTETNKKHALVSIGITQERTKVAVQDDTHATYMPPRYMYVIAMWMLYIIRFI